jgi:ribosome-associated protein
MAKTSGQGTKSVAAKPKTKTKATALGLVKKKAPPKFPKSVAGAVRAALDKQAIDIVVLDLRKADGFTDFFVICTGTNPRQVNAIADGVEEKLRTEFGERPHMAEGTEKSQWILLDYFNFVVHVFSRECRDFYELERLWGNAGRYEFSDRHSGTDSGAE